MDPWINGEAPLAKNGPGAGRVGLPVCDVWKHACLTLDNGPPRIDYNDLAWLVRAGTGLAQISAGLD